MKFTERFRGFFGGGKENGAKQELSPEQVKGRNLERFKNLLLDWYELAGSSFGSTPPEISRRILWLENQAISFARQAGLEEKDVRTAGESMAKLPPDYFRVFLDAYKAAEAAAGETEAKKRTQGLSQKMEGELLEYLKAWKQGGQTSLPEAYVKLVYDLVDKLPLGDQERIDALKRCLNRAGLDARDEQVLSDALVKYGSSRREKAQAASAEAEPEEDLVSAGR